MTFNCRDINRTFYLHWVWSDMVTSSGLKFAQTWKRALPSSVGWLFIAAVIRFLCKSLGSHCWKIFSSLNEPTKPSMKSSTKDMAYIVLHYFTYHWNGWPEVSKTPHRNHWTMYGPTSWCTPPQRPTPSEKVTTPYFKVLSAIDRSSTGAIWAKSSKSSWRFFNKELERNIVELWHYVTFDNYNEIRHHLSSSPIINNDMICVS